MFSAALLRRHILGTLGILLGADEDSGLRGTRPGSCGSRGCSKGSCCFSLLGDSSCGLFTLSHVGIEVPPVFRKSQLSPKSVNLVTKEKRWEQRGLLTAPGLGDRQALAGGLEHSSCG